MASSLPYQTNYCLSTALHPFLLIHSPHPHLLSLLVFFFHPFPPPPIKIRLLHQMAPPHTVPVLKVDMLASSCDRCGRGFKAKRKNCHNCGMHPSSICLALFMSVCIPILINCCIPTSSVMEITPLPPFQYRCPSVQGMQQLQDSLASVRIHQVSLFKLSCLNLSRFLPGARLA